MPTDISSTQPQHLWRSPSHPLDAQRRKPQEPGLGPPQKSRSRKNFLYNFSLQCLIRGKAVEEVPRNFSEDKKNLKQSLFHISPVPSWPCDINIRLSNKENWEMGHFS